MSFLLSDSALAGAERTRRDAVRPSAASSSAPVASTSAAPMSSGTAIGPDVRRTMSSRPVTRRKGKGKGRTMMIKIFYSLSSPRFGTSQSASTTPQLLPASTPTPDFLAVLDPALAPSSQPSPPEPPSGGTAAHHSCMARLSAPVWVQVIGGRRTAEGEDACQFGRVTLKTCLSAICISRPELVIDSTKDFSVAAVDPYESSYQRQAPGAASSSAHASSSRSGEGLVEGKGMLSWTLAEKKEGTTMVCGKIVGSGGGEARRRKRRRVDDPSAGTEVDDDDEESEGDEPEETLEVWLQLTERDAFTQGQFLDCLRSYHNPVQHLQNEMSEFASSPPKRRESAVFAATAPAPAPRPSTSSSGDPVKRKRPREQPVLPIPAISSNAASNVAALPPFATGPPESSPATRPTSLPSLGPVAAEAVDGQDPTNAAVLNQLLASLASGGATGNDLQPLLPQSLPLDSPELLPALQTLAKYYGLELPSPPGAPSQAAAPPVQPPAAPSTVPSASTSTNASTSGSSMRRRPARDREHFAAIDLNMLAAPPTGKQNPRDPSGCSNCKRKKSTTWREGTGSDGKLVSVCNACGIFFNKNGYHRSKSGTNGAPAATSPPQPHASSAALKGGRPLQGRLTATCEADLQRKARKQKTVQPPGIIPPLSPSKHVGPRSPALKFDLGMSTRGGGRGAGVAMSSPGRSPRLRYRSVAHPYPATSPLRGSAASASRAGGAASGAGMGAGAGAATDYESDGEERGPNPLSLGHLFGLNGSPSPVRIEQRPNSGGKAMPSYLLTASPGTALDRILNDTNIGSIGGMTRAGAGASSPDPMQLETAAAAGDVLGDEFSFFLQPGSPTARSNKENTRPRALTLATTTTDAPTTDLDSFESVLSSLRRDFNTRLSSNALTAPSSPAPSSPCVLPRTSTATPGSKGKAPPSGGREPPSILDSFMDGLVPGLVFDRETSGSASQQQQQQQQGYTPASDSDAWTPDNEATAAGNHDEDATVTLDSLVGGGASTSTTQPRPLRALTRQQLHDPSRGASSTQNVNRRAPFIPAHLLAPSDATEFDYGSLPPSSPPQLPSEAFPTPSDLDDITPSADGGDGDELRGPSGSGSGADADADADSLSLEAVAAQIAREPDVDARESMVAHLQALVRSGGVSPAHVSDVAAAPVTGGGQVAETVQRLLELISAHSRERGSQAVSPDPAGERTVGTSTSTLKTTRVPPVTAGPDATSTLSHFDLEAFSAAGNASALETAHSFGAGGQMSELYQDLFAGTPPF